MESIKNYATAWMILPVTGEDLQRHWPIITRALQLGDMIAKAVSGSPGSRWRCQRSSTSARGEPPDRRG